MKKTTKEKEKVPTCRLRPFTFLFSHHPISHSVVTAVLRLRHFSSNRTSCDKDYGGFRVRERAEVSERERGRRMDQVHISVHSTLEFDLKKWGITHITPSPSSSPTVHPPPCLRGHHRATIVTGSKTNSASESPNQFVNVRTVEHFGNRCHWVSAMEARKKRESWR